MRTNRMNPRLGAVLASSFLCLAATPLARADAPSLEVRVAAQKAIEQVYWIHRIWPKDNPGPKPPLSVVMPDAAIRAKVENDLRMSTRLDSFRLQPLTGEQLQAEIVRMVRQTKAPGMLRELFAALDDDPFLIAECLARPTLARRLIESAYAGDDSRDGAEREWLRTKLVGVEAVATEDPDAIAPPARGYTVPSLQGVGCLNDAWELSTLTDASGPYVPTARQAHTTIWTGSEMIVWGGWNGSGAAFDTGGRYDPAIDSWSQSSLTVGSGLNVPAARYRHTAIWTGTEMIVWGGSDSAGSGLDTGGRYNPATDVWAESSLTTASGVNVPTPRQFHTAVWTGTEMIVWGGSPDTASNALNSGGRYNPSTDLWAASTLIDGFGPYTPVARIDHTALWADAEMIVWGGRAASGSVLSTGGRYNPIADSWAFSSLTNASGSYVPAARELHTALWTGTEMVVWGGASDGGASSLNTGGRYNPSTDSWVYSSLVIASGFYVPTVRQRHTALWTGAEMIVWGGSTDGGSAVLSTGGRYRPATDTWGFSALTSGTGSNTPSARQFHTAIWTDASDHRMIVWGGNPNTAGGGLYCAVCAPLTWYLDSDGDGHGNAAVTQSSCTPPSGYVASGDDCNDTNSAINPGAAEVCNGLDDDCDTVIDDGGNALCGDGNSCTADVCDSVAGCVVIHKSANLDTTDFSASRVDGRDLVVLATAWNSCPLAPLYNDAANLDPLDPCIDDDDFHQFMNAFGHSCPP